jgi:AcrR family transcriptional regulator
MEETQKNTGKVDQIIMIAQRLFGIYGLEKVSMLEIAEELHLSKASLYYYFPDKMSIYKAVLEKEQEEFISRITEKIRKIRKPEKMLSEYAIMRLEYFSRLLNLSRLRLEVFSNIKPVIRETNLLFREKEMAIVEDILKRGVENNKFKIDDIPATASLFLDLLRGLRTTVITDRRTLVLDKTEFENILEKTATFTDVFVKGLKYR